MKSWHAGWVLAVAAIVSACSGPRNEGGGGGTVALSGPVSLTMVPRMVEGRGQVTFTPRGDHTEIHLRAEGLPQPATYALVLVEPETTAARHQKSLGLVSLKAQSGRIDHTLSVPSQMLTQWRGLELAHVPSGTYVDTRQEHAALVASIPAPKTGGGGGADR